MQISVTRGLAELKLLEKRIETNVSQSTFVAVQLGDKPLTGYKSLEEFQTRAQASLQTVNDLITRRQRIKAAIVVSNATTLVRVGMETMTVAEAIERKQSIQHEKVLLTKMVNQHELALREITKENQKVQERLDRLVEASLGGDVKVKDDQYESIAAPFLKKNEAKLVDPLSLRDKIDALQGKISEFEAEVDFVLSTSNAITMIEIAD